MTFFKCVPLSKGVFYFSVNMRIPNVAKKIGKKDESNPQSRTVNGKKRNK